MGLIPFLSPISIVSQIKSDSKSRKWSLRRQRRKVPPSTPVSNLSSSLVNTTWVTEKPSVNSVKARLSWSFWLITPHNCGDPKSNTTLCWPRPVSTTTRVNIELGTACGKYFRVGCLTVTDPGDSDIIKTHTGEQKA